MKKILLGILLSAWATVAAAQTSPNLTYGQVLTAAQWNNLFANKQDVLGYTPLNSAGGTMTGRLATSSVPNGVSAGFNLFPGSTPPTPVNGDLWATTAGLFVQINGTTIGPIGGATSSSFAGTPPISVSFPSGVVTYACANCGLTTNPLSQFASTTSAQLAGIIPDETGTGSLVFATNPILVTPTIGVATATSINKVAITAPATSATLTIANGKTLTASNTLTFTGTDGTSFAFPGISDTVVTLAATQTLGGKTLSSPLVSGPLTATSNSASAIAIGPNGATNPAFQIDASAATMATGIKITGKATGAGADISMISSAANETMTINAKGGGAILIANASTGAISLGAGGGGVQINSTISGSAFGTNVATALGNATGSVNGLPLIIASGTVALGTSLIAAGACSAAATAAGTGIATTDVIDVGFNTDPTAVTGYTASAMLSLVVYPTANTVNVKQCNLTASSITPSALTMNWKVRR